MQRGCVIILILLLYVTAGSGIAQTVEATSADSIYGDQPLGSPRGAMWRSLVLPGWGQWYNGQPRKALIIGGIQVGTIASSLLADYYAYKNLDRSKKESLSTTQQAIFRERYEDYKNWKRFFRWWFFLMTLYSMGDAYVEAHLKGFDDQVKENADWRIQMDPDLRHPQLQLQFSF
ncbi:MAG: hypothetical protein D6675_05820 [Gemmatimonadetes bacterium]|nr:MAG: hypothetical protein D6675_05820 [Gemmatimonadota bacterium]